jgi:hypothetical protein
MFTKTDDLIPSIHNYCDRWCERCAFTARCSAFAGEPLTIDDENISKKAFVAQLEANFAETKEMLRQLTQDIGLDLSTLQDQEFAQYLQGEEDFVQSHPLTKLAENYRRKAEETLKNKDQWLIFSVLDKNIQNELLETIIWYQPFIQAKVQRGLSGIIDFDGSENLAELNNSQSDANGSIKVGLIAVERSIRAWTTLSTEENSVVIEPLIDLLKTIKKETGKKFIKAQDFMRPGFDEANIEMVM